MLTAVNVLFENMLTVINILPVEHPYGRDFRMFYRIYLVNSKVDEKHLGLSMKCWILLTGVNLMMFLGI